MPKQPRAQTVKVDAAVLARMNEVIREARETHDRIKELLRDLDCWFRNLEARAGR